MSSSRKTIILASASPRRKALLESAGLQPLVVPANVDESVLPGETPAGHALRLSQNKADAVEGDRVLAADTVVVCDGEILGKPADAADAARMLNLLSGRCHEVMTGVCLRQGMERQSWVTVTSVTFRRLRPIDIERYILSGDPMDKAGAYGIQSGAAHFVQSIEGSYTNVVGLPLAEVMERLV